MAKAKLTSQKSQKSSTRRTRAAAKSTEAPQTPKPIGNTTTITGDKPEVQGAVRRPLAARIKPKRREKPAVLPGRLPSSFAITHKAILTLWNHKKLFIGFAVVYGILSFFLVKGFSSGSNLGQAKDLIGGLQTGFNAVSTGLALFGVLVTAKSSAANDSTNIVQMFLIIITSLAIIWALRHVLAGESVRIRDGFYKGMYPLVPVLLVILVIFLQTVPFLVGGSLFSILIGNAIAISWLEITLVALFFFLCLLLSLYWLSSSVIALYIVTLPDMSPLKALRAARDLVRWRRWSVLRKLIFLPVAVLVVAIIIMLPFLLFLTPVAPYVYFALSMVGILVVHAYLYTLYRELLA